MADSGSSSGGVVGFLSDMGPVATAAFAVLGGFGLLVGAPAEAVVGLIAVSIAIAAIAVSTTPARGEILSDFESMGLITDPDQVNNNNSDDTNNGVTVNDNDNSNNGDNANNGDDGNNGDSGNTGGDSGVGSDEPVVLDLDGNGIELIRRDRSTVTFDLDHDGYRERTAWVGPHDGMLVIDLAADGSAGPDGVIDQDREMIFTRWSQSATSDMAALREVFDTNHNGMLDAGDGRFSEFRVWQDANQNGRTDPGELKTLAELGIASIDLQPHGAPVGIGDGGTRANGFSAFTRFDGTHGLAADLSLAYDTNGFQVATTADGFRIDWQDGSAQRYFVPADANAPVTLDLAGDSYFAAFGSNGNDTFIGANGRANNIDAGPGDDHVTGGDQTDVLFGDAGSDTLYGGAGSDVLDGGTGFNRLDGGAGSDVALFDGPAANYTRVAVGGQILVRTLDGSENDALSNIAFLAFADQIVAAANVAMRTPRWSASVDSGTHPAGWLPVSTGDFNHDGTADVLWFNAASGDVDLWKIANGSWAGGQDIGPHPTGWIFAGSGDFNNDGTTDVLWYNPATGETEAWKIQNGQWAGTVDIGSHPLDAHPAGTGDFNGDGTSDVLWYRAGDGGTDVWIISNAQWSPNSAYVGPHPLGWTPVGTGDFDHDGTSDVLWYNPATGDVDLWKISNGQWAGSVDVGAHAAGWAPAGIGDFNGDGTSDIAWFNSATGNLEVWLMANGQWAASVNVGSHPLGWSPAGIGDFDHNGISDILWRAANDNRVETWLLAVA
jgi:hypothetical protein